MTADIREAFLILAIGMLTVFLILSLVVLSGQMLIKVLNKTNFIFNKKPQKQSIKKAALGSAALIGLQEREKDEEILTKRIIEQAIAEWSNGAATISGIKDLEKNKQIFGQSKTVETEAIEAAIAKWSGGKARVSQIQRVS